MEEATSSSQAQESSTDSNTDVSELSEDVYSFPRQINFSDSSYLSKLCDFSSSDSPPTDIAVRDQVSSSPTTAAEASGSGSSNHQKSANIDSENIPDHTTSDDLKESSTSDDLKESSTSDDLNVSSTTELSEETKNQSTEVSNSGSIDEIWSSDCEYSDSLREFREAFNCAVGTVLDVVKTRICWMCSCIDNTGARDLEELLRPLPPLMAPALKDAAVLLAAQKGEGHALVHLLAIGARGNGTDSEKRNALHLACMGGWDNVVYILLDYKAISRTKGRIKTCSWDPKTDFEAVDMYSKTPLDYARECEGSSGRGCVFYLERAIELQYNKRVRKAKKKS